MDRDQYLGLLAAGLGMLGQQRQYGEGAFAPVGRGGLLGLQNYQAQQKIRDDRDIQKALLAYKLNQMQRERLYPVMVDGRAQLLPESDAIGKEPVPKTSPGASSPLAKLLADRDAYAAAGKDTSQFEQAIQKAITRPPPIVSNVTLNTEKTLGGKIAEGIGEDVVVTYGMAKNALPQIESSRRIIDALDKGVIAGPGAKYQIFGSQLAGKLGYPTDEKGLVRTRDVIRELAEATLQSRSMLKGQGQVTEKETDLLERARSGDINSLSVHEIRRIAELNEMFARRAFANNRANMDRLRRDPYSAPLINMMESLPDLPAERPYAPQPADLTPEEQIELEALRKRYPNALRNRVPE